jgi:nicotinamide mononucleotide transporter
MGTSGYEIAGVLLSIVAVWLTTRENPWCWPVGFVSLGPFVVLFYQVRLYADMGLQVVYMLVCLYGWYQWLHGGAGGGVLEVSRTPPRVGVALAALGALGAGLLGVALRRYTDASLPFWDSSMASFSLVAQWMQARKWIENWVLWLLVDVAYVGMYLYKRLHATAGLYAVFVGLAVLGLVEWRRSLDARAP